MRISQHPTEAQPYRTARTAMLAGLGIVLAACDRLREDLAGHECVPDTDDETGRDLGCELCELERDAEGISFTVETYLSLGESTALHPFDHVPLVRAFCAACGLELTAWASGMLRMRDDSDEALAERAADRAAMAADGLPEPEPDVRLPRGGWF